jgi:peptide deformylase
VAVRDVLRHPHPSLKAVAGALGPGDGGIARRVAGDLLDTMRTQEGCVALAAPQIDEHVRVAVVDVTGHPQAGEHNGLLVLVNPRIVRTDGEEVAPEGCLSVPESTADVARATTVVVEALAPDGDPLSVTSSGFEARCIQHAIDHLDGVLFLDRAQDVVPGEPH